MTALLGLLLLAAGCDRSHKHPPAVECRVHLNQIDGAKTRWAAEHHKATNAVPSDNDLFGPNAYVDEKPKCPEGGVYTIGRVDEPPRCSVPGHEIPRR